MGNCKFYSTMYNNEHTFKFMISVKFCSFLKICVYTHQLTEHKNRPIKIEASHIKININ